MLLVGTENACLIDYDEDIAGRNLDFIQRFLHAIASAENAGESMG